MFFDDKGAFKLDKKEFVYLVATVTAVIAAVLYDLYERRRQQ